MTRLSAEAIRAYKRPEPLSEEYDIHEMGGSVHIKGIADKPQYDAIQAEISNLKEGAKGLAPVVGYTPTDRDIVQACYIASCVDDPALSAFEWLNFNAQGYRFLPSLFGRVLICSRLDEEKDEDGKTIIPEGVAAAKEALKSDQDPLGSGGSASV